ncbi:MAG: putative cysteine protease YraA [Planctomycetes bacterium ADurb.Bin401]|nr:MAG: putative cysteine protease YraA [Planctomycetes bacterium ADurb.Bin401]
MKKIAVLAEDHYETLELWYPYFRMKEEGFKTVIVGPGKKKDYTSKDKYPAPEEMKISDVKISDFDAVIIPGGYAPDMMRREKQIIEFVKNMFNAGKLVAYICHAGWIPASAGILKGKKATCFFSIKDDIINAGADYADKEVVVDGNLISSRQPDDLPAFCREIIKFLKEH